MRLIDKINHLRTTAAFMFDVGRSKGLSPQEIGESIKPIAEKLQKEIKEAPIKECVLAIQMMKSQVEALMLDKQFIESKIEDTKNHIASIERVLAHEIEKNKTHTLHDDFGNVVTLVNGRVEIR